MAEVNQQSVHALLGVVEQEFAKGARAFRLLLSSPGGSVMHGLSAYNYLRGLPATIETHNFGSIDSIAGVIYCAGTKRYSVPNARFLIHGVQMNFAADARFEEKQLREQIAGMETDRENIATVIAENCNKSKTEIEELMFQGTMFTPQQAKEFGLVHEIDTTLIEQAGTVIGIG